MCIKCKKNKQLLDHQLCHSCYWKAAKQNGLTIDGTWLDFWYLDGHYRKEKSNV